MRSLLQFNYSKGPLIVDDIDYLGAVSLFSHLKKRELKKIARLAQHRSFQAGEMIVRQGDRDSRLFIILAGEVDVIKDHGNKNERYLRTLSPTSYFGEMALIDDFIRSASVIARKETRVLCLDQWDLRQAILKHPVLAIELLQMLNRRIQTLEKSMIDSREDTHNQKI